MTVTALITDRGGEAFAHRTDVTDPDQIAAALALTTAWWGSIDALIYNAAVVSPLSPSSIAAHPAAMPRANAYATSKAALEAHTLDLAAELADTGVTVNAFHPGGVDTAIQAWIRGQNPEQIGTDLHQRFISNYEQRTLLTPQQSTPAPSRLTPDHAPTSRKKHAMPLLNPGDQFPTLNLTQPGNEDLSLPEAFDGGYGVVLLNRGAWCPYCTAQLRAFQRATDSLAGVGARVAALWVDKEATTAEFIAKHGLTFPLGHSADAAAISATTGAFVDPDGGYLQSTGFVLDPSGKVVVSVYSSGAIGRLVPEDVVGLIRYIRDHAATS